MNSSGLAVSLNILKSADRLCGLPVHVLLRAILDCRHMEEVRDLLDKVAIGKASHVLVADQFGQYLCVEFAAGKYHFIPIDHQGLIVHTNHYLADDTLNSQEAFPSTYERYSRAKEILAYDRSNKGITSILTDQSEGLGSICRPYSPSTLKNFGPVGTVLSLIMRPNEKTMRIRLGDNPEMPFYKVHV